MPTIKEVENNKTKRETRNLIRFDNGLKVSQLFKDFFAIGFSNLDAIKSLIKFYYPDQDLNNLYDFWHLRAYDNNIYACLENILEKLKAE